MATTEEKVNDIFVKYTNIDFLSNTELQERKLMGVGFMIPPRTMAYLYCKLEEELHMKFSQDAVISGNFDTFRNICNVVAENVGEEG